MAIEHFALLKLDPAPARMSQQERIFGLLGNRDKFRIPQQILHKTLFGDVTSLSQQQQNEM